MATRDAHGNHLRDHRLGQQHRKRCSVCVLAIWPPSKGRSTIAYTITDWFNDLGWLGSCYCFDHARDADRRQERIFSTITHDRDLEMR